MLRMCDIAERAGVSSSTVSFVLNDRRTGVRISEATRQRVLTAAEELGYRPNRVARAMRTGNTRMLGFLGGDLRHENVGRMLTAALEEADRQGYTLKVLPHRELEDSPQQIMRLVRRNSELRLMGLVALHLSSPVLEELHTEAQQYGYPLVLLDTFTTRKDVVQVISDDWQGVEMAIEHLARLGHRRIALISGQTTSTLVALRDAAFCEAMQRHNLPVHDRSIIHSHFTLHTAMESAARALLQVPASERPSAILCVSDLIAYMVVRVANALGLLVPRDLSVVGFADVAAAQLCTPPLTTIAQSFEEMGRVAMKRLLAACCSHDEADANPPQNSAASHNLIEVVPARLVERESTAIASSENTTVST